MSNAQRVFLCCGCQLLAVSDRRDTMTCSPACRTVACRNGSLKALRKIADKWEVRPGLLVEARALSALLPEVEDRVKAGELSMEQAQPLMFAAFWRIVTGGAA